jgi:[ribosomal protein S5]-alanine N-acetyltransferase
MLLPFTNQSDMKIETPRLILKEFDRSDLPTLAPILADPQVMKFSIMGIYSTPQTEKAIDNFIDSYKRFGFGLWAVILKESELLIGYCGLAIDRIDNRDEPEIGYRLDYKFWGKGFATEAASASIQYGFNLIKLPYILGAAQQQNVASIRVLEKLGMTFDRETIFRGVAMDVYKIVKTP